MSQNIFLLIRSDIKAINDKVDALSASLEDVKNNLPDVTELSTKLDGQTTTLETIVNQINSITDILNPDIPDLPVKVPELRGGKRK
ncbi:P10 [Spodoptera exempta nucleopolyhedrovirus]|uniref:P10 n=1 Tax=Spodoptera exempta nucleopolyhedrovirus TaxID=1242863 RepID=A0A410S7W6_9ABAC|nr:P10 [Spodoptera exempta nucleopolyhedrovirus]QAT90416.1 P10 [Spodoptera exempta nucleopolyhedrovirus]